MAKEKFNEEDGVWRTIGGRKVFIRKGQNLADAMIESGKFKGQKNKPGMRASYRKEKEKDLQEEEEKFNNLKNLGVKTERNEEEIVKAQDELISKYRENKERYPFQKHEEIDESKPSLREQYREEQFNQKRNEAIDKLNKNAEDGVRNDIKTYLSGEEDFDGSKEEFINELAKEWQVDKDKVEDLYQEQTEKYGSRNFKSDRPQSDPYDDPESEESQRLQSLQSRYDDYLQYKEGRGASYGEIAYIENLRGKDLDDFEKDLDKYEERVNKQKEEDKRIKAQLDRERKIDNKSTKDDDTLRKEIKGYLDDRNKNEQEFGDRDEFYNYMNKNWYNVDKDKFDKIFDEEESKRNKSTNETMNDAIREKASKKATKESTPNYSKYSADEQDILDGFGEDYGWDNPNKLQNLKEQIDYMRNPGESIRQTARRYATGGSGTMLIYTGDAEDYLKERNIKYDKDDPFSKYADVMAEQIEKLYNDASNDSMNNAIRKQANIKNAYKQYMKDHPESKMSLSEFKRKNK